MAVRPFEVNVRQRSGVAIIDLHGEIAATAEDLLNAAYAACKRSPATVLLNCADVTYSETTGMALLVGLLAQPPPRARRSLVAGPSGGHGA